jgi:hypothetical protein
MNVRTLWRGLAPSKTKEDTTNNSLRAMDVGVLTTLGTSACINRRKMMVYTWTDWHPIRELLVTSSLKEGAIGE